LVEAAERAVIGLDDTFVHRAAQDLVRNKPVIGVTTRESAFIGPRYTAADTQLILNGTPFCDLSGISTLRGRHNAENALAALAAVHQLAEARPDLKLWRPDALFNGLRSFPGLPHRMEELGRIGRVLIVNDSKATNADSTEKALAAFRRDIFWIAGGVPKEGGIAPLAGYFTRIAGAYLIGQAAEAFATTLAGQVPTESCGDLEQAFAAALSAAEASQAHEPVVLLSPACASFDQYKSFEHRGDHLRRIVTMHPRYRPAGQTQG
jgi:UDP-N-acetylmuramoylalanine--D-glutamate ligase